MTNDKPVITYQGIMVVETMERRCCKWLFLVYGLLWKCMNGFLFSNEVVAPNIAVRLMQQHLHEFVEARRLTNEEVCFTT